MDKLTSSLLIAVVTLLAVGVAHAQKSTELYIPVGKSPGNSNKVTVIGTCTAVQAQERTVTLRGRETEWIGLVTKDTTIFLDRSNLRLANTYGTFDDLRSGALIEVKYRDADRRSRGTCEWIKVQLAAPPGSGKKR